jgi:phosphatidylinositol-binding clathrin assembly protein
MARYAAYMESRVKAYRDLKHDAIRVQTESNRDHRVSVMEEDRPYHSGLQRSKTIAGRKLRVMTVDKGLLRETKIVQNMIDALVETKVLT